jgi:phosphatidate cytidylyltransferase
MAVLFVGTLAALCVWDTRLPHPCYVLLPLATIVAIVASDELLTLAAMRGGKPDRATTIGATGTIVASVGVFIYWPASGGVYPTDCPLGKTGWPLVTTGLALMVALAVEMRRYRQPGESIANLAAACLSFLYVGVFTSMLVQLRLVRPEAGLLPLVSLIAVVKSCDVGAYTFGRLFGRHKMAPVISPGKTLEGAAGGVLLAMVAAYVVFWQMGSEGAAHGVGPAVFGVVVGMTGMFGDLAESLLKRDAGVKDSSRWMPGFGGMLDVVDSILFAAPVAYLLWAAGVVHA